MIHSSLFQATDPSARPQTDGNDATQEPPLEAAQEPEGSIREAHETANSHRKPPNTEGGSGRLPRSQRKPPRRPQRPTQETSQGHTGALWEPPMNPRGLHKGTQKPTDATQEPAETYPRDPGDPVRSLLRGPLRPRSRGGSENYEPPTNPRGLHKGTRMPPRSPQRPTQETPATQSRAS